MRPKAVISRCKCPHCVAARRFQYVTLAALCVTLASSAYLARDLLRSKHVGFRDLTLGPQTFPHASPSSALASASPASQQHQELAAVSESQPAVVSAPISEPSPSSVESSSPPSVVENSPISQIETTIVWSPIVSGVSPGAHRNPSTLEAPTSASSELQQHQESTAVSETQPAVASAPISEPSSPTVEFSFSTPGVTEDSPVPRIETIVWSPIVSGVSPGARRDPSMVAIEKPEAESDSETVGVGQSLARHTNPFGAASSKLPARVGSPDHLLKKLEGPQKTRQNAPVQSSARLYFSKTTSPPKAAPSQQLDEVEASTPPDQGTTASKNASEQPGTGTGVTGDLRRFAASYLRADEGEDAKSQAGYYAGSVHFYNEGDLSWTRIAAATRRYHQSSPQRRYVISAASVRGPVNWRGFSFDFAE